MKTYATPDEIIADLRPGWRIVGRKDNYEEIPDPKDRTGERKIRTKVSTTLSIAGPNGEPDSATIREVNDPDRKGGIGFAVVSGPTKGPPAPPAPDVTSPGETTWIPNPNDATTEIGGRIVNGAFVPNQVNGRPQTRPKPAGAAAATPSTSEIHWTRSKANSDLDQGNVIVGTTLTPIQGLLRPHDEKAPTVTPAGSLVYIDAGEGKEQGNIVVNGALVPVQGAVRTKEAPKADVATEGQVIWQDIPDSDPPREQAVRIVNGERVEVAGLTRPKEEATTLIGNADSKTWTFVDKQGNVVRTVDNPNYQPPPGTALTPDLISDTVPVLKPDGTIDWQPNRNKVAAGQAMQDLLGQVGIQVDGNQMSLAQAKDLLTGAVSTMNARTQQEQQRAGVATGALTALTSAASTGAGLLNQRVSSAQAMLNNVLGIAGQGQPSAGRYGTLGGGLMNVPAGLGANLIGGIQGWTSELMGGQSTLDTAARLVRSIDPSNGESPLAQAAYGVLSQMLDRYGQETGQPHPLVAATQAATQTQGMGGLTSPVTNQQSQPPTVDLTGFRAPSMVDLGNLVPAVRGPLMG